MAINGTAAGPEQVRGMEIALRVSSEQQAVGFEHAGDPPQHLILSRLVEVDHDVAAENTIEAFAELPVLVAQIVFGEADERTQLWLELDETCARAGALEEKTPQPFGRQALGLLDRVDSFARLREHLTVEIRREDLHRRRKGPVDFAR